MTRVAIAAPTHPSLAALESLLDTDPHLTVVARSTRLEDVLSPHVVVSVDVILASVDDMTRLQSLLADLHDEAAPPPIVVLGDPGTLDRGRLLLGLGVRAVLPGHSGPREIVAALEAVAAGLVALTPEALDAVAPAPSPRLARRPPTETGVPLSPREREILALVAEGLGNKLVASRLGISEHTVKTHISSIFAKLGADTRAEAVAIGARRGMLML